ncbi:MBL fold metallo-hydrolase [Olivibacter sitiensis]|uniref:MBL fold metallo-hydrolase n=1 Tax=Olivibacter sitiensis TaxID=376470 RepID=UPI0004810D4F|nr:MBL fold metallo-hydrolase [Olivibacter sitiensis]
MHIEQFYDDGLAHASYALLENKEVWLVDPARDPQSYYDFADEHGAKIKGVIETHPHADFVSSHLEIHHQTGATIYCSSLIEAEYPHEAIDQMDGISLGEYGLRALPTPGHSPDSICIVLNDGDGRDIAVFTGDTLFVGDVGRPDLRENVGSLRAKAEELAVQLYHSLHEKLLTLDDEVVVYPAHGAGSLCGKNMSSERSSTIGQERKSNYALQDMDESAFVDMITADQPFVPKYFPYDVALNKAGADELESSLAAVVLFPLEAAEEEDCLLVDGRTAADFAQGHHPKAINLPDGPKFETWAGSIIDPGESFYLLTDTEQEGRLLLRKLAKIGYEKQVKGLVLHSSGKQASSPLPLQDFKEHPEHYTILDIRNDSEVKQGKLFANAIAIPLPRLRETVHLIPTDKAIVVHCAGGYRSAIGSSIIAQQVQGVPVYDLSHHVNQFQ